MLRDSQFLNNLSISKRGIIKVAASVLPDGKKDPKKVKKVKNLQKALEDVGVKLKSEKDFLIELRKEAQIQLKVAKTLRQSGIFKMSGRDVYEDLETGDFWKISEDKQHVLRLFKENEKGVADKRASKQAEMQKISEEYETSAHFTADLDAIDQILSSTKWQNWMKITDENYDTKCVEKNENLIKYFKELIKEIDKAK
jgi:hypothetical protein